MNTNFTKRLPHYFFYLFVFLSSTNLFGFELVCPPDVTVDCDAEIWDLSIYGNAKYKDYSGWHDAGTPTVNYHLNECNTGYITRTWCVFNPFSCQYEYCSQKVVIESLDIDGSFITWPKTSLDLTGCNPKTNPNDLPPGYQKPTWNAPSCSMIGVSYKDKTFYFGGACKKIVRTWTLLDCCSYNPITGAGMWSYNQEINITVSDVPQIECPSDITAESYDCSGKFVEVPNISIPNSECSENVVVMNDSPYATSGTDASGIYPIGTTTVTFTADFGCWQKTMCSVDITVTDISTPTPYCMYGLAISLMPVDEDNDGIPEDGMVQISASDFDKGSYDNCNPGPLTFSFSADVNDITKIFTCEHVGRNDITMYVTDIDGNQSYCNTYINVQNNEANIPNCEDNDSFSSVTGQITAHYGEAIKNVQLQAIGTEHAFEIVETQVEEYVETVQDSFVNNGGTTIYIVSIDTILVTKQDTIHANNYHFTKAYGKDYFFQYLPHYNDFKIEGISEDKKGDYINKADVLLIKDYIDGNQPFNAYQKMAADVNKDGFIDQLDLDLLNTFLQTKEPWDDMDMNWHFFDAWLDMDKMMEEGHACEEFCFLKDLSEDKYKINLKGYRIGDVTNAEFIESDEKENPISFISRQKTQVQAKPNPFSNQLTIEIYHSSKDSGSIQMLNNNGQVVLEQMLSIEKGSKQYQINDLNSLIPGIYHYQVRVGATTTNGKLVKVQ